MKSFFSAAIVVMALVSVSLAAGRVCNPTPKDVDPLIADFMTVKRKLMADLANMDRSNEVKNAHVATVFMKIFKEHGFDYAATLDVFLEKNATDPGYAPYAVTTGLLGIMQYGMLALQSSEGRQIAQREGFASDKAIKLFVRTESTETPKNAESEKKETTKKSVEALVGKHPATIFSVAEFNSELNKLLKDKYELFKSGLDVSTDIASAGYEDWYEGSGCVPHSCTIAESYFCINSKGKVYAAILADDSVSWFGSDNVLPLPLQKWMKEKGADLK